MLEVSANLLILSTAARKMLCITLTIILIVAVRLMFLYIHIVIHLMQIPQVSSFSWCHTHKHSPMQRTRNPRRWNIDSRKDVQFIKPGFNYYMDMHRVHNEIFVPGCRLMEAFTWFREYFLLKLQDVSYQQNRFQHMIGGC